MSQAGTQTTTLTAGSGWPNHAWLLWVEHMSSPPAHRYWCSHVARAHPGFQVLLVLLRSGYSSGFMAEDQIRSPPLLSVLLLRESQLSHPHTFSLSSIYFWRVLRKVGQGVLGSQITIWELFAFHVRERTSLWCADAALWGTGFLVGELL